MISAQRLAVESPAVLFANDDWLVSDDGLEHRRTGYFIGRERIGDRRSDGLWTWPLHMAEKLWCEPRGFAEAFLHAVRGYGLARDADLTRSLYAPAFIAAEGGAPEAVALGAAAAQQVERCGELWAARVAETQKPRAAARAR